MSRDIPQLQRVEVASPCSADWEAMAGDERVRHCAQCRLNVFNISGMTEPEAERLIRDTDGRLCVRLYRRQDGKILTQNCPVGLRRVRRKLAGLVGRVAAAVLTAGAALGVIRGAGNGASHHSVTSLEPFRTIQRWLDPHGYPPQQAMGVMIIRPVDPPE